MIKNCFDVFCWLKHRCLNTGRISLKATVNKTKTSFNISFIILYLTNRYKGVWNARRRTLVVTAVNVLQIFWTGIFNRTKRTYNIK